MMESVIRENVILPTPFPPRWASGWGEDDEGVFAVLRLGTAVMEMRWISPGEFTMGSPGNEPGRDDDEGPEHQVIVSGGFWLAETPCTQAQWQAVMGENPSHFKGDNLPVDSVNWDDCIGFCDRLNQSIPDLFARLPSEAEWEYACRAGTTSPFNNGMFWTTPDDIHAALEPVGWYDRNSGDETHPVKLKQANAWGLYDMHGNVWEWCQDWYGSYSVGTVTDPAGPARGEDRVVRGGCCWNQAGPCRSAFRLWRHPSIRFQGLGFRLAAGQPLGQSSTARQSRN